MKLAAGSHAEPAEQVLNIYVEHVLRSLREAAERALGSLYMYMYSHARRRLRPVGVFGTFIVGPGA